MIPPPPELEPYILYVGKSFMDKARKEFGIGVLARKPLLEIFQKLGIQFNEIDRDEAKRQLDLIAQIPSLTISTSDLIKNISLALFTPAAIFMSFKKKMVFRTGIDLGDSIILEFLSEIPRAFRPSLIYDIWLIIPKTIEGAKRSREMMKTIKNKVGEVPITDEEWGRMEPIRTGLAETGIIGTSYNLWQTI
ncbi:MAG: hypothetical protein ACPLY9_00160 [Nitrososphaerales archaeon]